MSNLKQAGIALLLYAEDYNNYFSPFYTSVTGYYYRALTLRTLKYIKSENTFICPGWSPRRVSPG